MSLLATVLLLWGFTLGPGNTLMLDSGSEPKLWAEPQSLLEPWANLTLVCAVDLPTKVFELIQNGWFLSQVRLETQVLSYRFSLGAITSNNSGIYRCRCGVEPPVDIHLPALNKWTMLSNAVEVTGKEPLLGPWLMLISRLDHTWWPACIRDVPGCNAGCDLPAEAGRSGWRPET